MDAGGCGSSDAASRNKTIFAQGKALFRSLFYVSFEDQGFVLALSASTFTETALNF